jgi:hypothetical protein
MNAATRVILHSDDDRVTEMKRARLMKDVGIRCERFEDLKADDNDVMRELRKKALAMTPEKWEDRPCSCRFCQCSRRVSLLRFAFIVASQQVFIDLFPSATKEIDLKAFLASVDVTGSVTSIDSLPRRVRVSCVSNDQSCVFGTQNFH